MLDVAERDRYEIVVSTDQTPRLEQAEFTRARRSAGWDWHRAGVLEVGQWWFRDETGAISTGLASGRQACPKFAATRHTGDGAFAARPVADSDSQRRQCGKALQALHTS